MQIFVLYSHLLLPLEFLSVFETTSTADGLYATSCIIFKEKLKKKCLIKDMGVYGRQHSEDLRSLGVDDRTATQHGIFQI